MHYTTSCNTQSSAPEDGRNLFPKYVELIGIINTVTVASSWCLYYCISDARSNKYQRGNKVRLKGATLKMEKKYSSETSAYLCTTTSYRNVIFYSHAK